MNMIVCCELVTLRGKKLMDELIRSLNIEHVS